jgi:hypothetical protein
MRIMALAERELHRPDIGHSVLTAIRQRHPSLLDLLELEFRSERRRDAERVRARIDERTNDDRRELALERIAESEVAVDASHGDAFWSECRRTLKPEYLAR